MVFVSSDRTDLEADEIEGFDKVPVECEVNDILEQLELGYFHYMMLMICGMAYMADAMELTILSYISICAGSQWDLSTTQVASISSSVFLGILIGNLFWGPLADTFGRRTGFLIGSLVIITFSIATAFAQSYMGLIVIRTCLGFGVGGSTIAFDILAEFLPASLRGQFLTNINYFWTFGSVLVAGTAWVMLEQWGWQVLAALTAVPVGISLLWAIWVMPESPRWLVLKGRSEEAEVILRAAARTNGVRLRPFKLRPPAAAVVEKEDTAITFADFLGADVRMITIPLFMVWFLSGLTYYGAQICCCNSPPLQFPAPTLTLWPVVHVDSLLAVGIIFFVSRIYNTDGGDEDSSTFVCDFEYAGIFYNAISEVVGVALTSLVIDRYGRLHSQTWLYVAAGIFFFFIGIRASKTWLGVVDVAARIFSMAATSVTMVVTPETFPTRLRATGHAVCSSFARIGGFVVPFVVNSTLSIFIVACILSAGNVFAAGFSWCLPETKDANLDSVVADKYCGDGNEDVKRPLLTDVVAEQ